MAKRKNEFANAVRALLFLLFVFVVVLFGINMLTKPAQNKIPQPKNATETTNWKTYNNTELGFQFKYPMSWKLERDIYLEHQSSKYNNPITLFSPIKTDPDARGNIGIQIWDNPQNLSIENYFLNYNPYGKRTYNYKDITIGKIKGKQVLDMPSSIGLIGAYVKRGSGIYEISLHANDTKQYEEIFYQILSTFKFAK